MRNLKEVYDSCKEIISNGVKNSSTEGVTEVVEVAQTMLDTILWFIDNHENPIGATDSDRRACSDVLKYIFEDLSYYMEEDYD